MFYVLSKLAFFMVAPSNLIWLLIGSGLVAQSLLGRTKLGFRLIAVGLLFLLLFGFSPLAIWLLYPLEQRFAFEVTGIRVGAATTSQIDGIIVLGGFEDGRISRSRGVMAVNESAERLLETVRLSYKLPEARVIFTGGAGGLLLEFEDAGSAVEEYLRDVGVHHKRIVIENQSRNTWENALLVRDILDGDLTGRYMLVTAAWHMPRAVGVFRQAGFDVIAFPVDFRTADETDRYRAFGQVWAGLERLDLAAKEYIGLVAYWLTGRSSALFPEPAEPRVQFVD